MDENTGFISQFSEDVVSFSSQYGSESTIAYTISNVAGLSTTYPSYGDFTQCGVLRTYGPWWQLAPSSEGFVRYQRKPEDFISQDYLGIQSAGEKCFKYKNNHGFSSNQVFSMLRNDNPSILQTLQYIGRGRLIIPAGLDIAATKVLQLSFDQKVYPDQVKTYETYNPGAVVRILCCDKRHSEVQKNIPARWFELYRGNPEEPPAKSRIFSPVLKKSPFPSNYIRLEFNQSKCWYYAELDAVEMVGRLPSSGSESPSEADPDLGSCVDPPDLYPDTEKNHENFEQIIHLNHCKESVIDKVTKEIAELHLQDGISAALDISDNGYFDLLPEEVIQMILSKLDLPTLCILSTVSRSFHKHGYDTLQYRDLNLQPYWDKVTDTTLTGFISRCKNLHRLNLIWCKLSEKSLQRFIPSCSQSLTSLRLSCSSYVNNGTVQLIAQHCPHLQDLDLSCCKNVENAGFTSLYKLSHLKRLNLYRTMIDAYSLVIIVKNCPDLEHLNLGSCIRITDFGSLSKELSTHSKNLKSLDLWRARHLSPEDLKTISSGCGMLLELDLGWCFELSSQSGCFVELAENCKQLRKLYVTANRTICDRDISALATHCKRLEQLDILGTREVTHRTIQRLLEQCPNMIFLDASFCHGLDSLAVEELHKLFPKVDIKRSFQS